MNVLQQIKHIIHLSITSEKFKFSLIIHCIALVHFLLIILFTVLHIEPMILFNIGSVILYSICIAIVRRNGNLFAIFCAIYLEITIHSFLATICIGWRFGFPQYIIALVPFSYYMCYTLINDHQKYLLSSLLAAVAFASFIGCRTISLYTDALYQIAVSQGEELSIYILNSTCNFCFLLLVTFIYMMEMQSSTNKLRSQNAILEKMAGTDPLTGLYNRRSMHVFLEHAVETETDSVFCLSMCDIDDFKKVNDTYGHEFGDVVLKRISQIIQQQVAEHGYVCRWGGEEILILTHNDLEDSCKIAENIRRNIENEMFHYQEKSIRCTLTVGTSMHKAGNTVEDTIMQADYRLYHGKRNGKNRVVSHISL